MGVAKTVVDTIRGLKSSYGLTKKTKPPVYVVLAGDNLAKTATTLLAADIATLAVTGPVVAVDKSDETEMAQIPSMTGAVVVSGTMEVHLGLEGMVDVAKELQKLGKSTTKLQAQIASQEKKLSAPGFQSKVSEEVFTKCTEKIAATRKELLNAEALIEKFKSMQV